ncbi:hypothetical protein IFR05_009347 [Cadophora sp. M221]|nr:hypothetical protein IFR05_009347 [Cadophora sp. M221]
MAEGILNCVWLIDLWILWLDCDIKNEFYKKVRRLGIWRAVADISKAMCEELGPNLCVCSEIELADALEKRPSVMYYATHEEEGEVSHIGLSSRSPEILFKLQWDRKYG